MSQPLNTRGGGQIPVPPATSGAPPNTPASPGGANALPAGTTLNDADIKTFTFGNSNNIPPAIALYYPNELRVDGDKENTKTSYVTFDFFEYVGPYQNENLTDAPAGTINAYNASAIRKGKAVKANSDGGRLQKVVLYMPEDLQAQYGTQWGGKSIQNFTGGLLRAAGNVGGLDPAALLSTAVSAIGSIPDGVMTDAVKTSLTTLQTTGQGEGLNINDVFGLTRGVVLNPNTELLFAGFDLRTFNLNFKLVARSQNETNTIRDIITTFKKAMLPSLEEDTGVFGNENAANFIKVPSLVEIRFMAGEVPHPYMTQFKPCALTGLNVNYTPDGSYAVYENFAPVAITLQLNFSETKLVYKEDINWGGATY